MIWLTALSWLNKARTVLWGIVSRYPLQAALIVSLCLSGWLWRGKEAALHRIAAMEAASKQNAAAALAQKQAEEARYRQLAKDADNAHAKDLADARDATARYIAAHRVQQAGIGPACPAPDNHNPGVRQELPAGFVMVSEQDVQRAAEWQAYGIALHDWAVTLPVNNPRVIDANSPAK